MGFAPEALRRKHPKLIVASCKGFLQGPYQDRTAMDEVVQMITASGTPDEVRAKVAEYEAAGCTCPILYPLGDVELMIDTFAV